MINPKSQIPNPKTEDWLEVGTIVSPQGLRGEVRVYPSSDFPERFEVPGKRWLLRPGQTQPQEIQLLGGRYIPNKNLYVVELDGVDSREDAEALRDCKLMVRADDRPDLEEGEYHYFDLMGISVYLQESGELVGTVVDVLSAGHDLLEVKRHEGEGKKVLIPFVDAIVPVVDLAAKRIEITPPSGLLDI